jgi:hypothetical protein
MSFRIDKPLARGCHNQAKLKVHKAFATSIRHQLEELRYAAYVAYSGDNGTSGEGTLVAPNQMTAYNGILDSSRPVFRKLRPST